MLYLDNGYLNFDYIYNRPAAFIFACGGRGIGKTFGALDYLLTHNIKFMFMRRTQTQADMISNPDMSPLKALEDFHGKLYPTNRIAKSIAGIYNEESNTPIGYITALTTISNIRGFDAHDVDCILYDEFIPEKHERPIKDEGIALLNAYETINRNRELNGKPPVKLIALSNSNRLDNPIYETFGLIKIVRQMEKKQKEEWLDKRGIYVFNIMHSPISNRKSETVLYKIGSEKYSEMALENKYGFDETNIQAKSIIEYTPICKIGEILIAKHKSKDEFYATSHLYGVYKEYGETDMEILRWKRDYPYIMLCMINKKVWYENESVKIKLTKYMQG